MDVTIVPKKEEDKVPTYFESQDLIIAKDADERGAYIAHFKTASIPLKPENEFDRERAFQDALKEADIAADKFKAALLTIKFE